MREWMWLACAPSVVRRAAAYAAIVGSILAIINHGDALLSRSATAANYWKMGITYLVPYLVSTLSSVGAMRRLGVSTRRQGEP